MSTEGTDSFSGFAASQGWSRSYVTQLRKTGRLVLTENGRRVRVAESLALIEATRDPSKAGVAARHASARKTAPAAPVTPAPPPADANSPDSDKDSDLEGSGSLYQRARAQRESYQARMAKLDLEERMGKLVPAADVRAAAADMGVAIRRRLESLPQILSSHVDDRDRDTVYRLATEHVEQALSDLSRHFRTVAPEGEA